MDKWKTVGSAGKDNDDSLWKEFNSARQTFYDRRRIYYAEQDRQFQNNADRKSRIVQEASAISSSCDYSSQSTERMKRPVRSGKKSVLQARKTKTDFGACLETQMIAFGPENGHIMNSVIKNGAENKMML